MPIIREIEEEFIFKGSGLPRSSAWETGKIHASDIIRFIEWRLDLAPQKKEGNPAIWDLPLCGEMGFIWEDILSYFLANRYTARIGEMEKDGIVGSPDAIGPDPWGLVPLINEEYKLTWKSANADVEKNWYYMTQFKTYAHMMGIQTTILRIIHIMADWSFRSHKNLVAGDTYNIGPVRKTYRFEWFEEELEDNWQMLLTNRDKMITLGMMEFDEKEMQRLHREGKI
jgi:hypothetical protein